MSSSSLNLNWNPRHVRVTRCLIRGRCAWRASAANQRPPRAPIGSVWLSPAAAGIRELQLGRNQKKRRRPRLVVWIPPPRPATRPRVPDFHLLAAIAAPPPQGKGGLFRNRRARCCNARPLDWKEPRPSPVKVSRIDDGASLQMTQTVSARGTLDARR